MSRTIPRAYVTAAWSKNRVDAEDQARKYCSELVKAGYLPLCPVLAFSGIISEEDADGEKKEGRCQKIFCGGQDFLLFAVRRSMKMLRLIFLLPSIPRLFRLLWNVYWSAEYNYGRNGKEVIF